MTNNEIIQSEYSAPSNIAIVKYWGKKGLQEPVNPSISFTLSKAKTTTKVSYEPCDRDLEIDFKFDRNRADVFLPKLHAFVERLLPHLPFLKSGILNIESTNTFPHSSGIASSASSMAALAKTLIDIQIKLDDQFKVSDLNKFRSRLARLGSGSASRSTMNGWVLWGETPVYNASSDKYGVDINKHVHESFKDLQDTILIIRKGSKAVSSTQGHQLMENHPYKEGRIKQANNNIQVLIEAFKSGDFESFSKVCEQEALSLHGLMMSSSPAYTLLAPESIRAIRRIQKFRDHQHVPLTYTLDAGPNIHLIYPSSQTHIIKPFIEEHLRPLCENSELIYDQLSLD